MIRASPKLSAADRIETANKSSKKLVELDLALVKSYLESGEAKENELIELIEEASVIAAETEGLEDRCRLGGSAHHLALSGHQRKLADLLLEQRKLTCDVGKRLEINAEIATLYRPIQVRELRTALVRLVVYSTL